RQIHHEKCRPRASQRTRKNVKTPKILDHTAQTLWARVSGQPAQPPRLLHQTSLHDAGVHMEDAVSRMRHRPHRAGRFLIAEGLYTMTRGTNDPHSTPIRVNVQSAACTTHTTTSRRGKTFRRALLAAAVGLFG